MFENLYDILNSRHITVNKLAKLSSIASSDLYCALKGHKPLYPNWRRRIAAALEVPEEELFKVVE